MKRFVLLPILGIAMAALMSSCLHRGTVVTTETSSYGGTTVAVYHYWYYPSIQVYYDSVHRVYYYPENGAWIHTSSLPVRYKVPANHVEVEGDRDKPYRDYDKHVKMYPPHTEKVKGTHGKKQPMKGSGVKKDKSRGKKDRKDGGKDDHDRDHH